jgi:hypothetical protein
MIDKCPVPQCFVARALTEVETLLSQIHKDLNQRGEQQGEQAKTFDNMPFACCTIAAAFLSMRFQVGVSCIG